MTSMCKSYTMISNRKNHFREIRDCVTLQIVGYCHQVVTDDDQKLKMQILGNLAQAMLLFNVDLADAIVYCT